MPSRLEPVDLTSHGIHWPGRCAIEIFYYIGQGLVLLKCILTYRPASEYFSRPVHYTKIPLYWLETDIHKMYFKTLVNRYTQYLNYNKKMWKRKKCLMNGDKT